MSRQESLPAFVRSLPEADLPIPGARGWLLQGATQQVVFVEFAETVEVPEHAHQEQWEFALAGRVDLRIGGGTRTYAAGDNFFIPAGEPHGATVHAGYKAMIAFNATDRYRPKET